MKQYSALLNILNFKYLSDTNIHFPIFILLTNSEDLIFNTTELIVLIYPLQVPNYLMFILPVSLILNMYYLLVQTKCVIRDIISPSCIIIDDTRCLTCSCFVTFW